MSAPKEDAGSPHGGAGIRYVTVMLIPIMGGNTKIQNRTLVFSRPPTKEFALQTVNHRHQESMGQNKYFNEWARCADIFRQIPEEMFAKMYQRRATSITYLVDVFTNDGVVQRMFSARSCPIHEVPAPSN